MLLVARRRDTELFDADEEAAVSAIEHWGAHVIYGKPDPDCAACARRAVWQVQMDERGGGWRGAAS